MCWQIQKESTNQPKTNSCFRGAWKRKKVGHESQTNYENNSNPNLGWLKFPTSKSSRLGEKPVLFFQWSTYIHVSNQKPSMMVSSTFQQKKPAELQQK